MAKQEILTIDNLDGGLFKADLNQMLKDATDAIIGPGGTAVIDGKITLKKEGNNIIGVITQTNLAKPKTKRKALHQRGPHYLMADAVQAPTTAVQGELPEVSNVVEINRAHG